MEKNKLYKKVVKMAQSARTAALQLAIVPASEKNRALLLMAKALVANKQYLMNENKKDIKAAEKAKYSKALVDRLILNDKRINEMARCLTNTARLKDPVGTVLRTIKRPNGLLINKLSVPFGVIGIIYESRPNVTSDCIGLCLKSGNATILKGGKEAVFSNSAIFSVLTKALKKTKIPEGSIQLIDSTDRASVNILLKLDKYVDLIIPRGGEGLIHFVVENSNIPVVKHYKGVCHVYVSDKADLKKARAICYNAKVQRPGVCNAMETMLVHKNIANKFLPIIIKDFKDAGVEIRGCDRVRKIIGRDVKKAVMKDWEEEYLDLILAVKIVNDTKEAVDHINDYGSKHSDAIITDNKKEAEIFLRSVDSACLYVNASTRFTDGYEFGFGAEVGISTDKLHARGPMALEELTTYKYLVYGRGQIRT